jgi:hypothetical protein
MIYVSNKIYHYDVIVCAVSFVCGDARTSGRRTVSAKNYYCYNDCSTGRGGDVDVRFFFFAVALLPLSRCARHEFVGPTPSCGSYDRTTLAAVHVSVGFCDGGFFGFTTRKRDRARWQQPSIVRWRSVAGGADSRGKKRHTPLVQESYAFFFTRT